MTVSTVVWWYGPQAGVLTTNHLFPTLSLLTLSPLTVDAMIASVCACTVSVVASCRLLHVSARTQGLTLLQYWMRHTMPLNYVETRLSGAQFAASRGWVTGIDYHGPTSPDEVAQAMNTDKDRANRAAVSVDPKTGAGAGDCTNVLNARVKRLCGSFVGISSAESTTVQSPRVARQEGCPQTVANMFVIVAIAFLVRVLLTARQWSARPMLVRESDRHCRGVSR